MTTKLLNATRVVGNAGSRAVKKLVLFVLLLALVAFLTFTSLVTLAFAVVK